MASKFVEAGMQRVKVALSKQGYRGNPSFADLNAAIKAALEHMDPDAKATPDVYKPDAPFRRPAPTTPGQPRDPLLPRGPLTDADLVNQRTAAGSAQRQRDEDARRAAGGPAITASTEAQRAAAEGRGPDYGSVGGAVDLERAPYATTSPAELEREHAAAVRRQEGVQHEPQSTDFGTPVPSGNRVPGVAQPRGPMPPKKPAA